MLAQRPSMFVSRPEDLSALLERLWLRLRDLSTLGSQLNWNALDDSDRAELDRISRITAGYASFILSSSEASESDDPPHFATIKAMSVEIELHCDQSTTALRWAMRDQSGEGTPSIRVQ